MYFGTEESIVIAQDSSTYTIEVTFIDLFTDGLQDLQLISVTFGPHHIEGIMLRLDTLGTGRIGKISGEAMLELVKSIDSMRIEELKYIEMTIV